MRLADEPGFPVLPPGQPTRDLLLAQALDACITAERRLPGSSQEIIARQPAWARGDLQRLVGLAGSLDAATSNAVMSSEFRVAARARLMRRIGAIQAPEPRAPAPVVRLSAVSAVPRQQSARGRTLAWATRVTASLVAAVLAVAATLTASASALPGEPLYGLKEAQEELAVRMAADDQQRTLALLRQANVRLDETARLLQQGRTMDAAVTTLRYDQIVQRATMSYVGTINSAPASAPATLYMEASLSQDHDQLLALLQFAPEPARADLREALVATERGRALVADPRPVERGLGRREPSESAAAAAVPTVAAEDNASPSVVPTVPAERVTVVPTRHPVIVLLPTPTPVAVMAEERIDESGAPTMPVVAQVGGQVGSDGGDTHGDSQAPNAAHAVPNGNQGHRATQHPQTALAAPTATAHDEPQDTDQAVPITVGSSPDQGGGQAGRVAQGIQNQADRSGQGQDVAQPSVVRQPPETAAGAGSDGTRGSASTSGGRSSGGDDAGTPARVTAAANTGDRPAHDTGGDANPSPTAQATATKPPSSSASSASPTGHHGSDGEQKPSPPPAPAQHNGGGNGGSDHAPANDVAH